MTPKSCQKLSRHAIQRCIGVTSPRDKVFGQHTGQHVAEVRLVRVLIVDDHALTLRGHRAILRRVSCVDVVGEATDSSEAVESVRHLDPDIFLIDIQMPRLNGISAAWRIVDRKRTSKIHFVTKCTKASLVQAAVNEGSQGYIYKDDVHQELRPAIQSLTTGERYFSKKILELYPHFCQELQNLGNSSTTPS